MKLRNLQPWLPYYLWKRLTSGRNRKFDDGPIDLIFCIVDHFEPRVGQVSLGTERERMRAWEAGYPKVAGKHRDSDGIVPRHTWFFPIDEYWDEHLASLARLQKGGFGEVEVHLHHGHDTSEGVLEKLDRARKLYAQHGLLCRKKEEGKIRYAFIHGNWALDNSRGKARWCGVDDEITVLYETGCYADFTFPSLINPTQPRLVNALYYALDDPGAPKSYDRGQAVQVGQMPPENGLLMITGPVALNWRRRKLRCLPTIENADLSYHHPPSQARIDLWVKSHIHVLGQPNWIFVKLHTHGALDGTRENFTREGDSIDELFSALESRFAQGHRYRLHYATARELFNMIRAAEDGHTGNPHAYRDYQLILRT